MELNFDEVKSEPVEPANRERRGSRRYDMRLEVRWKLVRRRRVIDSGGGYTLDLSSSGVRFHVDRDLQAGMAVHLSISWPVRLDNVAPMQLALHGKILRSGDGWVAIRTSKHEFRTLGAPAEPIPVLPRILRTPEPWISRS